MNCPALAVAGSCILAISIGSAFATDRFVNLNNPSPSAPFTSWETAATTIQDAVDAAGAGDVIFVTNGVYASGGRVMGGSLSSRVVVDKALTLQSVNGPGLTSILGWQVPGTLNGDGAVRGIYLTNNATLVGFTVSQGATLGSSGAGGMAAPDRQGGGIYCRSGAVVSNCVVTGNAADSFGGGVYAGKLYACTLSGNSATNGGGANVPH
jgi:hypothetical protein